MKEEYENLMKTALKEMENGQHTDAANHFDLVVINESENIDAPFFRAYCKCYDIRIGDMPNAAVNFTNAFCRYVDEVKKLNNPDLEKEKLDYAIGLLSNLVSNYKFNSKRMMISTPSISLGISSAAKNMNNTCINKLKNSNANVSENVLSDNETKNASNNSAVKWAVGLIIAGVALFILWEVLTDFMIFN